MNTIPDPAADVRRRQRLHSDEFKATLVASCLQPGKSMASVAMANDINANLPRRWVHDAEMRCDAEQGRALPSPKPATQAAAGLMPVALPTRAHEQTSVSSCAAAQRRSPSLGRRRPVSARRGFASYCDDPHRCHVDGDAAGGHARRCRPAVRPRGAGLR